jgi:hypothetical protein
MILLNWLSSCAALLACGLTQWSGSAEGAVRVCTRPIVGLAKEAALERTAKKLALQDWSARAGESGEAFNNWRLAKNKILRCQALAPDKVRCQAIGTPCRVSQVPPAPTVSPKIWT